MMRAYVITVPDEGYNLHTKGMARVISVRALPTTGHCHGLQALVHGNRAVDILVWGTCWRRTVGQQTQ